ncbi:MAG TPA: biotin synthase BioB [Gammaproteobacteria bacterium]|nr:biotin synthase BioB [Gammaproteobacteria bacterium]
MPMKSNILRYDWQPDEVLTLFHLPFADLLYRAQTVHRQHFDANDLQLATLLSIKTGRCSEDCAYCPQSIRHGSEVEEHALLPLDQVVAAARQAQQDGAGRFCMGAAWRSPRARDIQALLAMVEAVRALGMETCLTAGMLNAEQARQLRAAGLDYYNHNIDTSAEYYPEIISTRTFQDRLDTLQVVRDSGLKVCSGGIVGMGETEQDRAAMLQTLAGLQPHPESVPINRLVRVAGTPLEGADDVDGLALVRTIAVARILMPASRIRLSAGREDMEDELQALCFLAGANAVFYGDHLLTTANASVQRDRVLFTKLGLKTHHHLQSQDTTHIAKAV